MYILRVLQQDEKGGEPSATDVVYWINRPQVSIGRKEADILMRDLSVSRLHAVIVQNLPSLQAVMTPLARPPAPPTLSLFDHSKFGTWINERKCTSVPLPAEGTPAAASTLAHVDLQLGDVIRCGTNKALLRVEMMPLFVCTSHLLPEDRTPLSEALRPLGARLAAAWSPACTHLAMSRLTITAKLGQALAAARPIVTPAFFRAMAAEPVALSAPAASTAARAPTTRQRPAEADYQPKPDPNGPPLVGHDGLPIPASAFQPDPARATLFAGKRFYFLTEAQLAQYGPVVAAAGGTATAIRVDTITEHFLRTHRTLNDFILRPPLPSATAASSTTEIATEATMERALRILREAGIPMFECAEIPSALLAVSFASHLNMAQARAALQQDGQPQAVHALPSPPGASGATSITLGLLPPAPPPPDGAGGSAAPLPLGLPPASRPQSPPVPVVPPPTTPTRGPGDIFVPATPAVAATPNPPPATGAVSPATRIGGQQPPQLLPPGTPLPALPPPPQPTPPQPPPAAPSVGRQAPHPAPSQPSLTSLTAALAEPPAPATGAASLATRPPGMILRAPAAPAVPTSEISPDYSTGWACPPRRRSMEGGGESGMFAGEGAPPPPVTSVGDAKPGVASASSSTSGPSTGTRHSIPPRRGVPPAGGTSPASSALPTPLPCVVFLDMKAPHAAQVEALVKATPPTSPLAGNAAATPAAPLKSSGGSGKGGGETVELDPLAQAVPGYASRLRSKRNSGKAPRPDDNEADDLAILLPADPLSPPPPPPARRTTTALPATYAPPDRPPPGAGKCFRKTPVLRQPGEARAVAFVAAPTPGVLTSAGDLAAAARLRGAGGRPRASRRITDEAAAAAAAAAAAREAEDEAALMDAEVGMTSRKRVATRSTASRKKR